MANKDIYRRGGKKESTREGSREELREEGRAERREGERKKKRSDGHPQFLRCGGALLLLHRGSNINITKIVYTNSTDNR